MSCFWQGFKKQAGLFGLGLKPDTLVQVEQFNKNVANLGKSGIDVGLKADVLDKLDQFNKNLEGLKSSLDQAPKQWGVTGSQMIQEAGDKLKESKKISKRRLLGYAALAGGGLAIGSVIGNKLGRTAVADNGKTASIVGEALKTVSKHRGRNSATGKLRSGGFSLGGKKRPTTIRYRAKK